MERGELGVLILQFGILFVIVLAIGNFLPSQVPQSGPAFTRVYWGAPEKQGEIPNGATITRDANETSIYAYFQLAASTSVTSFSASRFCLDPISRTGESKTYVTIAIEFEQTLNQNYLVIAPVGQRSGWSCTYSVQITDSLGASARWAGTVTLGEG